LKRKRTIDAGTKMKDGQMEVRKRESRLLGDLKHLG